MIKNRSIELTAGESALIGGTRITLVHKSGKRARIVVQAPEQVQIVHPITSHSAPTGTKQEPSHDRRV